MAEGIANKVEQFFAKYPKRIYPKGQILIHGGDEPRQIFYIVSGKIRQYDITYRGEEAVVNIFKSGAFFPMAWALSQKPNQFFFDTDEKTEVRVAPYNDVLKFLKDEPEVTYNLLTRVYTGLDGVLGRMVHLMSSNASDRILYEILLECRRFGETKSGGGCQIGLNEKELAVRAGLSRETVSRELHKVQETGEIKVSRNGIFIKNLKNLEKKFEV